MNSRVLGRVTTEERRRGCRRLQDGREVIANHWAFGREERLLLKQMERRRTRRRTADVSGAMTHVT